MLEEPSAPGNQLRQFKTNNWPAKASAMNTKNIKTKISQYPLRWALAFSVMLLSFGCVICLSVVSVLLEPGTPDPHQAVGEESSHSPQQVALNEVLVKLLGFFV
jgi:hypothetical protein